MNAYRIYTRKVNGLDNTVWFFMIGIMLFSLILLSSFLISRTKCIPFSFSISPKSDSGYYTEKTLSFSLSVSSKNVSWDFGDGTPVKTGVYVTHQYHKEGKYYVTASIKEDCQEIKEITVNKNPFDHTVGSGIAGPQSIPVGKVVDFDCLVYGNVWNWQVIDHPEIKASTNGKLGSASFRFTNGGTYFIEVTLDNDRTKSYRKEIFVTDGKNKPVTPVIVPPPVDIKRLIPEEKKGKEKKQPEEEVKEATNIRLIGEKSFKDLLNEVIEGGNSSPFVQDFDQYLFRKGQTRVNVTGITGVGSMNFKQLYDFLSSRGDIKVSSVKIQRDPADKTRVEFIEVSINR